MPRRPLPSNVTRLPRPGRPPVAKNPCGIIRNGDCCARAREARSWVQRSAGNKVRRTDRPAQRGE